MRLTVTNEGRRLIVRNTDTGEDLTDRVYELHVDYQILYDFAEAEERDVDSEPPHPMDLTWEVTISWKEEFAPEDETTEVHVDLTFLPPLQDPKQKVGPYDMRGNISEEVACE